jgi:uncharacterized membrane protein (Fun14 family)
MSEIIPPFLFELGVGGIGGFVVGYAVKKLSKFIIILVGLFILALIYLGVNDILMINYAKLWETLANMVERVPEVSGWIIGLFSLLPFMGSFLAGFFIGLKMG